TRNYHAYLYTDRTDGSMFGPEGCTYVDMLHLHLRGKSFLDDKKFTIADLLTKKGSALGYLYDLGDQWDHEITVEDILPPDESTGKFSLLDGSGACPG
ncbi:MM3350-like domain-containing protein, partial [Kalaharituber pfeilii]